MTFTASRIAPVFFVVLFFSAIGSVHAVNYTNTIQNGGTINSGDAAIVTNPLTSITGNILNNGSLQFWQSGTLTDSNLISGNGYLYQSGTGTTILGSANTYTAGTSINAGVLSVSSIADGTASSLGSGSGTSGWVGLFGGTLNYTGLGSQTTTRSLWIDAIGSGQGGGNFNIANAGASLTWNPGSGNIIYNVTKTGAGTFTLGGVMSGTSALNVNGGTMNLRGVNTSTGAVVVNGGTLNVTGTGQLFSTINGNKANAVTVQNGGELQIDNWGGWPSSLGTLYYDAVALVLNGGTLTYQGTTANGNANRGFTVGTNGATFNAASVGQTWVLGRASGIPAYLAAFNGSSTLTGVGNGQMDQYITGSGSLTKNGSGTWTLTGINTYTGGTIVNAGTLAVSNALANNGSSTITVNNGGTLQFKVDNVFGVHTLSALTPIVANAGGTVGIDSGKFDIIGPLTLNGGTLNSLGTSSFTGFALKGAVTVNGGTNASTISGTGFTLGSAAVTGTTFNVANGGTASGTDLTVSANIYDGAAPAWSPSTQASTLTKTGSGIMKVTGNASYTGGTTVNAGSLIFTGTNTLGSGNITVGGAGGSSTLSIAGGATTASTSAYLLAGTVSGDRSVVNVASNLSVGYVKLGTVSGASGALNISGGANAQSGGPAWWAFMVGATNGGYGSVRMTGGSLNLSEIGIGSVLGGTGVVDLLGGTMTVSNWFTMDRADPGYAANVAALNISGGTLNASSAGNGLGWGSGGYGVINVGSVGTANFGANALRLAYNGGGNPTNIVTLGSGGTLQSAGVTMNASGTAGGTAILNFNGGTIQATTTTNAFLKGLTAVTVGSGGGTINNAGNWIQIDQNLLAPTGSGLSSITLSNGGSGYIGAPVVQISGGGGSGATAIAQIDTNTGAITNIFVTSAGSGYTSAPTVTLVGGGASMVASGISVATNAATSGGLTFNGSNVTLLTGNNTFGGGITVNGGVLQFNSDAQLGNSTNGVTLNGGQLYNNNSAPVIAATRTITLGSNGGYLMSGWGSNSTYQSSITGPGSLGISWDSGTVTLAGSNSYTGTTTIGTTNAPYWWNNSGANPTLKLGNSNALTAGGALSFGTSPSNNTATLNLNGYSASVGGLTGTNNAVITNGTGSLSTVTIAPSNSSAFGGVIAGNVGLVKNGTGTETLSGQNTYSGGTVINAGTLSFTTNNALLNNATNSITINNGGTAQFAAYNVLTSSGYAVNSAITVNNGGTLLNSGNSYNILGAINLNGGTINSAGTNSQNGIGFELGGPVTVNGGTNTSVITGNGIGLSSATNLTTVFNVASGGTSSGIDLLVSGKLVNGSTTNWPTNLVSSLTKTGAGVMMLSNNNTYTGATLVSGGTLRMGVNNAITTNSAVTLTNGGTIDLNGTAQSVASLQINGSSMTQSNGSITSIQGGDGVFAIGAAAGNSGSYSLSGGTITLANAGNLQVGQYGNGTFTQTGGAVNSGSWTVLGRYAGSTGVYNISGGSLIQTNLNTRLIVGESGSGTMTVSGSASVTSLGGVSLAWGGGNGVLNLNGGILTTPSIVGAAYGGSGTQTLNLNGGTIVATASTNTFIGGLTAAHILSNGVTLNDSGYALTIGQSFDGAGGFTKTGVGAVTLSSGNTYAGGTVVSQGTLKGGVSSSFGTGTIVLGDANTGTNNVSLAMDTASGTTNQNAILVSGLGSGSVAIGGTNTGNSVPNVWAGQLTLNTNVQLFANNTTTRSSFTGQITGNGGITVTQGRVTLDNSSNNYAGATVVNAGTILQLNDNEVLPNSTALTVNGTLNFNTAGGTESVAQLVGAGVIQSIWSTNTLAVIGNSNSTFGGTIQNGSGTLALSKGGTGTLTLNGNNTYTGATTVSAGRLILSGSNSSTAFSIATNSVLELNVASGKIDNGSTVFSGAGNLLKTGSGTIVWGISSAAAFAMNSGSLIDVQGGAFVGGSSGNEVWTSNQSSLNVASGASFNGTEANVRVDSLTGSGTVTSGFNGYGYSGLTFGVANGSGTFSGTLANTDPSNVGNYVKAGSGTQVLSGSNNYTGTTTVAGGTLRAGSSQAFGLGSAVTLSNTAGATLDLNGYNNTVSSLQGGGSQGGNVSLGNGTMTVSGRSGTAYAGVISGQGGVNFSSYNTSNNLASASQAVYSNSPVQFFAPGVSLASITNLSGAMLQGNVGVISTNARVLITGNNGTTLTGQMSYYDAGGNLTKWAAFTLTQSNGAATNPILMMVTNAVYAAGNYLGQNMNTVPTTVYNNYGFYGVNSLTASSANVLDAAGSITNVLSGTNTYTGPTVITGGKLVVSGLLGGGNYSNTITDSTALVFSNSVLQTLGGAISGAGSFAMAGTGTTILAGSNTYSGLTTISAGTLQVGNGSTNGTLGGGAITDNGTLVFNRSDSLTVGNVISGNGLLVQAGTGSTVLTGTNTYTGGTIVNAGSLVLKAGAFEAGVIHGTATVNNGGNLVLDYSTGAYPVASTDTINVNGGGTLTLSGGGQSITNAYVGTLALNSSNGMSAVVTSADASGLRFGRQSASVLSSAGSATNTYSAGMVLVSGAYAPSISVASNNALNLSGTVSDLSGFGGAVLTKNGAGTLIFSGSNSYSGATVISGGTLQVGNGFTNGTLGSGGITDNGTLAFNRSDAYLVSNVIGGSGGIVQNGSGTTILTGANNNSGNTVINSGTLQVGNGGSTGALGSGNITNNASLVYNLSSAAGSSYTTGSGSLTQAGTGTFTVYQTNTYTGGTYITRGGTIAISAAGALTGTTNINLGTTNSRGTLDLSAKSAAGYAFGTNQTLSGNGTITTGATNRTVTVNGTLNPGNSIGTLSVNGNLTLGSSALSVFELGTAGTFASPGQSDRTTVTGNLALGGSLSLLDNAGANGQGAMSPGNYRLFTYGGSLSGSFTNTPPSLIYNNTLYRPSLVTATLGVVDLDIAQLAAGSFFTNSLALSYHVAGAGSATAALGISNTVAAGGGSLGVSLVSNSGTASVAGAGFTNLSPSSSTNITISVARTNVGVTTGSAVFAMNDTGVGGGSAPLSLGSNSISYTATGYNLATASLSSTNVDLGRIHAGGSFATTNLTISNSAPVSSYTETLGAGLGAASGGVAGSGSLTGLNAGSSDNGLSLTLTNTTAGAKSGTIAVAFASQEVGGSGLGNTSLGSKTVNVTGFVYSGQGVWATNGGTWSSFGNWQQAGGVAGIDGALSANDTVTFGSGGSGTVTLDGATPSLQSVTFSNNASTYTIAQGSGGTLTLQAGNTNASINVQAGSHSISAPLAFGSDVTIAGSSNTTLTLGSVSGSGGLTQIGNGTTILGGSNSYIGITKVSGGTLTVNGSIAGALQVDAGAMLNGTGSIAGDATIAGAHSAGNSPGLQSFGSSLTYKSTSTILLEFTQNSTAGRGVSFDAIDVAGNLSFDPGSVVSLTFNSVGSSVNWNDLLWNDYVKTSDGWLLYRVDGTLSGLENVTITGTFLDSNGVALGAVQPDAYFNLFQVGSDIYLNYAVPEPSTHALLVLSVFALVLFARNRRGKTF